MNITPAEFALIVKGNASEELKQRFLREAQDPDGELRRMLRGAEKWASAALNLNSPSPAASRSQADEGVKGPGLLRRAAFTDVQAKPPDQSISRDDLTQLILGTASEDAILRVRNALEDPSSELSLLLGDLPAE